MPGMLRNWLVQPGRHVSPTRLNQAACQYVAHTEVTAGTPHLQEPAYDPRYTP